MRNKTNRGGRSLFELAALSTDSELDLDLPELEVGEGYVEDFGEPEFSEEGFTEVGDDYSALVDEVNAETEELLGENPGNEGYMSRKELRILCDYSQWLLDHVEGGGTLPEWGAAHVTTASTYIRDLKHCIEHGDDCEKE